MSYRILLGVVLISLMLTTACSHKPVRTYPAGTMGTSMRVSHGQIIAIETVTVEGQASIVGTLGGAAVGNSVGRTMGGGSGQRVAGAVGAVAGAVAGRAVEQAATSREAVEIIVRLDSGRTISIVQEDEQMLRPGDRVRVLQGRRTSRVIPV